MLIWPNSLVFETQCGLFRNFLSLQFYMKSIFVRSLVSKSAILSFSNAQKFDFGKLFQFLRNETKQILKLIASKIAKMPVLELIESPKLDFT